MATLFRVFIVALVLAGTAQAGPLFEAAGKGDLATTERLLDEGAGVDERGRNKETPLIAAALAGSAEIAALLIDRGADVMARNRGGYTALHAAAYSGSVEIARLLLDHGAALEDRENVSDHTPLFLAAEEDRIAVAELLLARGADPTVIDRDGFSVLTQSWAKKRVAMVRLLKQHGATCQTAEVLGSEDFHRRCAETGH